MSTPPSDDPPDSAPGPDPKTGKEPVLPTIDAEMVSVWPAASGREILADLVRSSAVRRPELAGLRALDEAGGASSVVIYQAGAWCLKTSPCREYTTLEEGRRAMLWLARRKTLLGALLPPRTVLCLQPDGAVARLWTVSPWLRTLRDKMAQAAQAADDSGLENALRAFARAAIGALRLATRVGMIVDVHPSNFAASGEQVVYLDDDIGVGYGLPGVGHALLRRVDEYEHRAGAVEGYLMFLERALPDAVAGDDKSKAALARAIAQDEPLSESGRRARARLLRAVERS